MRIGIVTVGDELLDGEVVNTNAAWLATRLDERGVDVRETAVLPDEIGVIAERVREFAGRFDAVLVTGGVGGTPDDVTMDAVAAAFDRELVVEAEVSEMVVESARDPDALCVEAWAALPAGARPIPNDAGLCPGCVIENVYVFPGVPPEMEAVFGRVADEFAGDRRARTLYTARSESEIVGELARARDEFGVAVGSYPNTDGGEKRIKVVGSDAAAVDAAADWLVERL